MSYNPVTDFLALLRSTSGGVRTEQMPGLDYTVAALARAGLITLFVGQTAPTVNQPTTVWFQPAVPSSSAEGAVFLWNATASQFQPATPTLWSNFIAGPVVSLIPPAGTNAPIMDGTASVGVAVPYSRQDHVHPSDTSRAPVASPTFTGTPTAPTATLGDQSTLLATTAFVIANGGLPPPIGTVLPYAGSAAPNANWQIATGQALSRTGTTALLFAALGITFGAGDGVTTFNVPDMRGRAVAGVDGGANRLTTNSMTSQALGGTSIGPGERFTIVGANLPAYTPSGAISIPTQTFVFSSGTISTTAVQSGAGTTVVSPSSLGVQALSGGNTTFTGNAQGGVSTPIVNVQPTIELNYIIRIS